MHGLVDKHIYGDASRLFLNTELGCNSSCSYCYLPVEGLKTGASQGYIGQMTARELLQRLHDDKRFVLGTRGTLLSIGCYSECWDARNQDETIALVQGLLELGNPIQLATKRSMTKSDLVRLTASKNWSGQLSVYISSATVTQWRIFERGTAAPDRRFASFAACREAQIRAFLYIKPVIPRVTILDVEHYGMVMSHYNVGAVVGQRFERSDMGIRAPISSQLSVVNDSEVHRVRAQLSAYGQVFDSSVAALQLEMLPPSQ